MLSKTHNIAGELWSQTNIVTRNTVRIGWTRTTGPGQGIKLKRQGIFLSPLSTLLNNRLQRDKTSLYCSLAKGNINL